MFERFTERARQVVVLAQDEAKAFRHNYIGTEHILLGLLREQEGVAARVLDGLGVTVDEVRGQVARIVGRGDQATGHMIPFTPRAKKVLELSLREALTLGDNYIGTEHVLLGLVRENEGLAARILLDLDADPEKVRNDVVATLAGEPARVPSTPARRGRRSGAVDLGPLEGRLDSLRVDVARLGRRLVAGYALAGLAFPAGLLVGWLIWG